MNKVMFVTFAGLLVTALSACSDSNNSDAAPIVYGPPQDFVADVTQGRKLFYENCATCHGTLGQGSNSGPPLIHKIYEPSHHSDGAFYIAVQTGTRQHHWKFGDMPPVSNVKAEEIGHIVAYVRERQRRKGIE